MPRKKRPKGAPQEKGKVIKRIMYPPINRVVVELRPPAGWENQTLGQVVEELRRRSQPVDAEEQHATLNP